MPWLVRWLDRWRDQLATPEAAALNGIIVAYLLLAIAWTIDLTRPFQAFDYVRF